MSDMWCNKGVTQLTQNLVPRARIAYSYRGWPEFVRVKEIIPPIIFSSEFLGKRQNYAKSEWRIARTAITLNEGAYVCQNNYVTLCDSY